MIQDNRLRLMQLAGPERALPGGVKMAMVTPSLRMGMVRRLAGQPGARRNATTEYWQHMLDSYAEQADNMPLFIGRWCWRGHRR